MNVKIQTMTDVGLNKLQRGKNNMSSPDYVNKIINTVDVFVSYEEFADTSTNGSSLVYVSVKLLKSHPSKTSGQIARGGGVNQCGRPWNQICVQLYHIAVVQTGSYIISPCWDPT